MTQITSNTNEPNEKQKFYFGLLHLKIKFKVLGYGNAESNEYYVSLITYIVFMMTRAIKFTDGFVTIGHKYGVDIFAILVG